MKVLVTGGAGYIGSHCAKLLKESGYEVIILDSLIRGHRDAASNGLLVEADICDHDAVFEAFARHQPDAVVHFAALALVGESMSEPGRYFLTNVVGTQNLLDAMQAHGVQRIVFSSTCATYGEPSAMPITEKAPQLPVNPYGQSKLMAEHVLRAYGDEHGIRWAILRYFNVVGCDPEGTLGERHEPETHLIPLAIQAALGRGPALKVFGDDYPTPDGTAIRDYLHVWDLVDAHRAALELLANGSESLACNLGTGRGSSVKEVLASVASVGKQPVPHEIAPRRAGDPPELVADVSKANRTLEWEPRYPDLTDAVRHTWAWLEKNDPQRK